MTISPEESILSQSRQEAMENLLSTLSPQQSRVIKLRYIEIETNLPVRKQLEKIEQAGQRVLRTNRERFLVICFC
jgi:DNA-directed RNA polymerase sigma subunit (sigma70/sigma32)